MWFTKKIANFWSGKIVFVAGPGAHQSIILRELPQMYLRQYGYALRPENFGESNLTGMIIFMIFLKNDDYKVYHIELVQTKWLWGVEGGVEIWWVMVPSGFKRLGNLSFIYQSSF